MSGLDDEEKTRALMLDLAKVATVAGQRLEALTGMSEDVQELRRQVEALDSTIQRTLVTREELDEGYPSFHALDTRIRAAETTAAEAVDGARRRVNRRTLALVAVTILVAGALYWNANQGRIQADYDQCVRSNESRVDLRDAFVASGENFINGISPTDGSAPSERVQAFIDKYRADTLRSVRKFAPRDCEALYPQAHHKENP